MKKLIKFSATWCLSCKDLAKVIEANPPEVDIFEDIDVDNNMELTKQYEIRSVPTLIILKDGKEVNRMTGKCGPARLKQFVDSVA